MITGSENFPDCQLRNSIAISILVVGTPNLAAQQNLSSGTAGLTRVEFAGVYGVLRPISGKVLPNGYWIML